MPVKKLEVYPVKITGSRLSIVHCTGAWESFLEAIESLPFGRRDAMKATMDMLVRRLSNGERLSKDSFPQEGSLPSYQGKPAKQFYGFKKIPIRAYGWYSERVPQTFYISHYTCKKAQKLSEKDTLKVQRNWTRIEVNSDET